MRAQRAGAETRDLLDEAPAALLDRKVEGGAQRLFVPDPIQDRRTRPMRDERQTQQGFVEMDMAFHEGRHEKRPGAVEHHFAARSRLRPGRHDGGDRLACDRHIDQPSIGQAGVGEQQRRRSAIGHGISPTRRAATTL